VGGNQGAWRLKQGAAMGAMGAKHLCTGETKPEMIFRGDQSLLCQKRPPLEKLLYRPLPRGVWKGAKT